ncbi:MAG: hypothetical protein JJE51_08360 [Thermoanaerobaculia bacterium]|nr:hypothetical protein [Thermoanaerobaculia bacterium]
MSAILFLYRHVLEDPIPWVKDVVGARRSQHVPAVFTWMKRAGSPIR